MAGDLVKPGRRVDRCGAIASGIVLAPEDLIPALALVVLAGLRGKAQARYAIFALPAAWLLGGLVAADASLPTGATTALAASLGIALGSSNGAAMAEAGPGPRGVLGIVGAVFVAATLAAVVAASWQEGWMRIAWRVAGSWIAASGLLLLGWSLR